jgi:ATP synthase F0 subunit b
LFWIFKHFLGDKLASAIATRREQVESFDNTEKELAEKIEAAEAESKKILDDARNQANNITSDATELAKKSKEKIIAEATMEADSKKKNALADIEKERLSMVNEMKDKVVDLSLKLNEKIFKDEKANKDFMQKELDALK